MLTPEYYNYCTDEVIELYSKLDETITRDIARRIMKTGYVTEGAKWLVEVEREAGLLYDDIIEKVAEHAEASEEAVRAVFNEAGLTSKAFDDEIYESAGLTPVPLKSSPAMLQVLTAGIAKTNGLLNNLTKTTALTSQTRFIEACSLAEFEITSGAFDYNTAIRHAVEHAVEQGTMVEYASGARRSLESAVRTAVMTGVSQTTGEISIANAKELGTDLMEISAHGGARPSHAEWQGQIVSLSGDSKGYLTLSDIGYGTIEGFKGINCRHDWWPFIEGISTRAYTDEELKDYRDEIVEFNGKEMSVYEATQRQRAMERQIRQERSQLAGLDEAIKSTSDKELKESLQGEFDHLALKMKGHEAKYNYFSEQTGLPPLRERMQTNGFNRSVSQKVVRSDKRLFENAKKVLSAENMPSNIEDFNRIWYNPTGKLLSEISSLSYEDALKVRAFFNNRVTRLWYIARDKQIPDMVDKSLPIEIQARQAFTLRNKHKVQARNLMLNQDERKTLDARDPIGTFEALVEHKTKHKGLSGDDVYRDIIEASTKTRESVNKKLGLG